MIYIKTDFALNNLQWLICHKTQPTNQPTETKAETPIYSKQLKQVVCVCVCVCVWL